MQLIRGIASALEAAKLIATASQFMASPAHEEKTAFETQASWQKALSVP